MLFLTLSFLLNYKLLAEILHFLSIKSHNKAYSAKIPNNNIFKKNFKIKPGSIMALAKITKYPDIFKI